MKIRQARPSGNTLVVMMIFAAVISMSLLGVLSWSKQENRLTARSDAWNAALPLAESGVEEALAHIAFTNNLASGGWNYRTDRFIKRRHLGSDYYDASILTNARQFEIISKGSVRLHLAQDQFITRTVRVTVTNDPLFTAALRVKNLISLAGNNLVADSFDSRDPAASTGGLYDPFKRQDAGNVHAGGGIVNPLPLLGGSFIYGRLQTELDGLLELGKAGSVGSLTWVDGGMTGIQPGYHSNDLLYAFAEIKTPAGGVPAAGGLVNGIPYQYVLPDGKWTAPDITGSVYVSGDASLTVSGNILMTGGLDSLVIAPGASLKLYMQGFSATFAGATGAGVISNLTGRAASFQFYGENSLMVMSGTPDVTGLFYVPRALTVLGKLLSSTPVDIKGAMVTSDLQLLSPASIHYDEAARQVPSPVYKMDSWAEW